MDAGKVNMAPNLFNVHDTVARNLFELYNFRLLFYTQYGNTSTC